MPSDSLLSSRCITRGGRGTIQAEGRECWYLFNHRSAACSLQRVLFLPPTPSPLLSSSLPLLFSPSPLLSRYYRPSSAASPPHNPKPLLTVNNHYTAHTLALTSNPIPQRETSSPAAAACFMAIRDLCIGASRWRRSSSWLMRPRRRLRNTEENCGSTRMLCKRGRGGVGCGVWDDWAV